MTASAAADTAATFLPAEAPGGACGPAWAAYRRAGAERLAARVYELLARNNAELERRRAAESEVARLTAHLHPSGRLQ